MDRYERTTRLNKGEAAAVGRIIKGLIHPRTEHLPKASEVKAALKEAVPEASDKRLGELYDAARQFAQAGVNGMDRIELGSRIDEFTLALSKAMEAEDSLLPSADDEEVDAKALADEATRLSGPEANARRLADSIPDVGYRVNRR